MRREFWFYFVNFWTLFVFAAVLYDFLHNGQFTFILNPIMVIYVAILTIYVGAKEFERWFDHHTSMHPGELHVIAWTVLIIALAVGSFALDRPYHISPELISTYISVLSILAITQKSKDLYRAKRRR